MPRDSFVSYLLTIVIQEITYVKIRLVGRVVYLQIFEVKPLFEVILFKFLKYIKHSE
jgi:hypothetical protein